MRYTRDSDGERPEFPTSFTPHRLSDLDDYRAAQRRHGWYGIWYGMVLLYLAKDVTSDDEKSFS